GRKPVVGLNTAADGDREPLPIRAFALRRESEAEQVARLREARRIRDQAAVDHALTRLRDAAEGTDNTVPFVIDAVRSLATVGEICETLTKVWGQGRAGSWHLS